jgi:HEXXH motif-containing protein
MSALPPLHDLTLPEGSTATARKLLAAWLQFIARDAQTLPMAVVAPHNRALWQTVQSVLRQLGQREPAVVLQLLRLPTLSTLVQTMTAQAVTGGDHAAVNRWLREWCALVLLELAGAGRLPTEGVAMGPDAQGRWPVLLSPTLGLRVRVPASVRVLRFGRGQLCLDEQILPLDGLLAAVDGVVDRPYHLLAPGLWLAEADNNPLSEFEAHPDKHGNQLDLGGKPASAWVEMLQQSLGLVARYLPVLAEEMKLLLRLVVPVGWDAEKHLSASYREAIGVVYMTLHPNLMTMTEALIHEYQHNKINAAFCLDPLLSNAWSPLYASPVRPDPRPLHGVILAVHAFQPVAALYEAMAAAEAPEARTPSWRARYQQICRLNAEGAKTVLDHAQPTPIGQPFFEEMRRLDGHFRPMLG